VAEDLFLQRLAAALNWPYLELAKLTVQPEARNKISTKVAFQYSVQPTAIDNGAVQVAVSNPFDTATLNAVRFDARGPVDFALAPRVNAWASAPILLEGGGSTPLDNRSPPDRAPRTTSALLADGAPFRISSSGALPGRKRLVARHRLIAGFNTLTRGATFFRLCCSHWVT
jgi:hypothetical protein